MLQNLEDTAYEVIHYRTRTVIEETRGVIKIGHSAFNPRLSKEAKSIVFPGQTAQDLKIIPITGGYDLNNATSYMEQTQNSIDLTQDTSNTATTVNNEEFKLGIPETPMQHYHKQIYEYKIYRM